ncbi:MAG TPA: two-component sensor histidine kinase [Mogibacterium sp.]|nr:two-component sensor histidine kinase [Mogibacterium sp.]
MKQKINTRLLIIAALAIVLTTFGTTFIYYNIFAAKKQENFDVSINSIADFFMTALPVIIGIAVIMFLVSIFTGHLLTRNLLRNIEQMAEDIDDNRQKPVYAELTPFAEKIRTQHENILAAAKSRQDFTANVSHELKTPITTISGYSELIENKLVDSGEIPRIAGQIHNNADRLLSLINDIIRLSELDHGELPRAFEQLDLYETARECVNDLQALAQKKSISLICEGVSAGIIADRSLIREMIENLVHNAIRYNKEGGKVKVIVTIEKGHPKISVRDTGIGIESDEQDRVFERFYRVDKSRSRETGGTGLGLAIVKHIADIHFAEISLQSAAGEGTEIVVTF